MSVLIGWALLIGIPALLVWSIVQDARAQAAHERLMEHYRAGGEGR